MIAISSFLGHSCDDHFLRGPILPILYGLNPYIQGLDRMDSDYWAILKSCGHIDSCWQRRARASRDTNTVLRTEEECHADREEDQTRIQSKQMK